MFENPLIRYRKYVGGGNTSAAVSRAFEKGVISGLSKFIEVSELHALKAVNALHLSHADLAIYTTLFLIANPVVAVLYSTPLTHSIGAGLANTPLLASAWLTGELDSPGQLIGHHREVYQTGGKIDVIKETSAGIFSPSEDKGFSDKNFNNDGTGNYKEG